MALTLRTLGGLTNDEIARAFLVAPDTMKRRLSRARTKISVAGIPFSVPPAASAPRAPRCGPGGRLSHLQRGLRRSRRPGREAIALGAVLAELMPDEAEVHALLGADAAAPRAPSRPLRRRRARPPGRSGPLPVGRGADRRRPRRPGPRAGPARPRRLRAPGCDRLAPARASPIDWPEIGALYEQLSRLTGSPVVELNRAVAVAEAGAPREALAIVDGLSLDGYRYLHSTRAELLRRLDRPEEAAVAYRRALELTDADAERPLPARAPGRPLSVPRRSSAAGRAASLGEQRHPCVCVLSEQRAARDRARAEPVAQLVQRPVQPGGAIERQRQLDRAARRRGWSARSRSASARAARSPRPRPPAAPARPAAAWRSASSPRPSCGTAWPASSRQSAAAAPRSGMPAPPPAAAGPPGPPASSAPRRAPPETARRRPSARWAPIDRRRRRAVTRRGSRLCDSA